MEQNKLEISFEIKKKHFYIVSGIFLVFIAAILVNAIPSNFWGHTGNDINVIIPQGTFDPVSNTEMSLQDAINGPTPYLNPDWRSSPKITYYSSHSDDDLGVDVPIGAHAACGMTDFYKYVGDSGGTIDANEVISFYLGLGIFDFSGFGDIFSSGANARGYCGVIQNPAGSGNWILKMRRTSYCGAVCVDWFP